MSGTESEEFESADEEFHDSPKKGMKPKTKQELPKQINVRLSEKAEDISKKTDNIGSGTKDFSIEKIKLNEEAGVKVSDPVDNAVDGWDADEWGDGLDNQISPLEVEKTDQREQPHPCNEDNADEDAWSDFDDWTENSPAKTGPTSSNPSLRNQDTREKAAPETSNDSMNSVFPILDQMSPDKQPKKPEGILHNLSKFVNNSEFVSSYDAFPVLNEISPRKVNTDPPFPNEVQQKDIADIDSEEPPQVPIPSASSASSWVGWSSWGGMASAILSTATEGVTTITSQVSQGLSSVLETGIGAPGPEEMARLNKEQEKARILVNDVDGEHPSNTFQKQEETLLPSLGNLVSGVTHIGNKVITGGLDTLEGIGKKTMTILQENDALLLNKRKFLGLESEKPVLSQVLREAKEKSEEIERNLKQMHRSSYKKQLHFESLFDHYYGLVHLEALEMLSKQSFIKLQSLLEPLTGKALAELQETLDEVKELCDLGELENDDNDGLYTVEELTEKLSAAVEDLGVQADFKDIIKCWNDNVEWLVENPKAEAQEVYEKGLRCLAETSALAIHRYHKIAEMLLIKDHHSTANEADSLVQLTTTFCWHLSGIANRFSGKLNTFEQTEENNQLITSIFVEVYNSNSYIQSAFQLFIPLLQIGAA